MKGDYDIADAFEATYKALKVLSSPGVQFPSDQEKQINKMKTFERKTLKQLRGDLARLELIKNPSKAQLKEIGWVRQCIEMKEQEGVK